MALFSYPEQNLVEEGPVFDIGDPTVVVLDDKWCNCTGLCKVAVMVGLLRVRLSLFSSTDWQAMLGPSWHVSCNICNVTSEHTEYSKDRTQRRLCDKLVSQHHSLDVTTSRAGHLGCDLLKSNSLNGNEGIGVTTPRRWCGKFGHSDEPSSCFRLNQFPAQAQFNR
ncbi:hypothetical protein Gotur_021618 [Gossypium turneri]